MKLRTTIRRESRVERSVRVEQMLGMFDVPPEASSRAEWSVHLDLPDRWSVGVIVGRSGDGKTTVGRWLAERLGTRLVGSGRDEAGNAVEPWAWPTDASILDGFPATMGIKEIVGLLSSVGFSSPPAWVRPFRALSNGQQFRVNLARSLAECRPVAVVDEFTSVVDRTVARIGSAAVAKTVRRLGQRFVAVTCHYDVLDWLEPDWVYEPATDRLTLNDQVEQADAAGRSVRRSRWRRPAIRLRVVRADRSAWALFAGHHYLSREIKRCGPRCFVGLVDGQLAAFVAAISFPHPVSPGYREHRAVCLPDFQGCGIGNALSAYVASLYAGAGHRYTSTTSHPSMIAHRARSPLWRMIRAPSFVAPMTRDTPDRRCRDLRRTVSCDRLTASFQYVGAGNAADARAFGVAA